MGIVAKNIGKTIGSPPQKILTEINVEFSRGEFVALTGRSGSGKSTLLYLLSSLDLATEGSIELDGREVKEMTSIQLEQFRNEEVGFIFQFHYLIAELSAIENILLPARKTRKEQQKKKYAQELLSQFGIGDKADRLPRELSGGEQQRVAIARSLIMNPKYLFADEPTGSLDTVNGELVMNILKEFNEIQGTAVLLVTHDPDFAAYAHRKIHLVDGKQWNPTLPET